MSELFLLQLKDTYPSVKKHALLYERKVSKKGCPAGSFWGFTCFRLVWKVTFAVDSTRIG